MVPAVLSRLVTGLALFCVAGCSSLYKSSPAASHQALRVMTYNIESGNGNLDRTAGSIRRAAPDLVGLQEVDVHWAERSNFVDQAAALGASLAMEVRFARIYQFPGQDSTKPMREFGVALLSRYPIVAWTNHPLMRLSTQQQNPVPAPLPGFLEARINVAGSEIRVFNTHLDYRSDPSVRAQQVREIIGFIGDSPVPTLLLGDLNAKPDAPELQPLLRKLDDTWPLSAGDGFTYPATAPVRRIDYVLASKHFLVRSASVEESLASDHRPVIVNLVLASPGDSR
jgi:endonuclease/exonuclease/phosphatase family metal-dependent hydrolase